MSRCKGIFLAPEINSTIYRETYVNTWLLRDIWFLRRFLKHSTLFFYSFLFTSPLKGHKDSHTDRETDRYSEKLNLGFSSDERNLWEFFMNFNLCLWIEGLIWVFTCIHTSIKPTTNTAAAPAADNNGECRYFFLSFIITVTKHVLKVLKWWFITYLCKQRIKLNNVP